MMRKNGFLSPFVVVVLTAWSVMAAEQHRATRLGNPATRFAPPLRTTEDLRSRFRDPSLRPDIVEILRQWGWSGRIDDLYSAAATGVVREVSIPIGSTMPFMSSREAGKPVCLRNVLWEGSQPAPAFAFNFKSTGRLYRCVTPKACSNFFLEDLGPEPIPALALECIVPDVAFPGRPVDVCLIVRNPGTGPVLRGVLRLEILGGVFVESADGGTASATNVNWDFADLMPNGTKRFCAQVRAPEPTMLNLVGNASALDVKTADTTCSLRVQGIPAILIDAIDLEDPVQVGSDVTYEIKVTNQGSSEATNVKLVFNLPSQEVFVSGGGASPIVDLETKPIPVLSPKAVATWRVVVRAKAAGDVRFKIQLTSDQFQKPINEEESTLLYE